MSQQTPYQRHVDFMRERAPDMGRALVEQTLQALRAASIDMAMANDRKLLFQVSEAIQGQRHALESGLATSIRAEMDADSEPARLSAGFDLDKLTLVDEHQAEHEIEIARTVQLIELSAEWEWRELQALTATLEGEQTLRPKTLPFRPAIYARALSAATQGVGETPAVRQMLLRVAGRELATLTRDAYQQACERLRQQGLKPLAFKAVTTPRPRSLGAVNVTQPGALQGLLDKLGQALPTSEPGQTASAPAFKLALRSLDTANTNAASQNDPKVIALLTRIFNEMVKDQGLQPMVRTLIDTLQPSVLQVAQHEPHLLRSDQHPAWRLINQVADYASGYAEPHDADLAAFVSFLKPLVQRLSQAPTPNGRQFADTLTEVQRFIDEQSQAQLQSTPHTLRALQEADHRLALQPIIRQQIAQQLAHTSVKDSIREFLLGAWVDVLTRIMASEQPGDEAQGMLTAVDDLLGSLHRPASTQEQDALRLALPGLIKRLQSGMALIEWPAAQQDAVLNELMAIHTHHLRAPPKPARSASATSAQDIVRQLREEMAEDSEDRPRHPQVVDTNVGTLPTVPMQYGDTAPGQLDDDSSPAQADWVESLQKGQWCKLCVRGQWTTVHLLWISANRQFFIFASDRPARMHSLSQAALTRLRAEGLATSLEERSLMQRAIDSLLQDLD
jgi:hypothetical protein